MIKIAKNEYLKYIHEIEKINFINPWSENQTLSHLNNNKSYNLINISSNIINGYLLGEIIDNSNHLYKTSIIKKLSNKGIGSLLINRLIKFLKELNILYIYLEVRASNNVAIKLYDKFDFKLINTRKKYYNDNEDALLYTLKIK